MFYYYYENCTNFKGPLQASLRRLRDPKPHLRNADAQEITVENKTIWKTIKKIKEIKVGYLESNC